MAFQLALGCTGGTTHRECCDECDPTTCSLTVVHEVDGSITVTWYYSSPYEVVASATLNGVDILGDPNTDTGIATFAFADLPDELTLVVTNICGDSICEYVIPCCWKYDMLRVSFRNVADIALSCSEAPALGPIRGGLWRILTYDFTLDITGLTALNGTWLLDLPGYATGALDPANPLLCNVDESTDIYVGDVSYVVSTVWTGRWLVGPFLGKTYQETYDGTIPGKLYIRKVSPTGIILVFVPDETSYQMDYSSWNDTSTGSPVTSTFHYCLDNEIQVTYPPSLGDCPESAWIVGNVTQPSCGVANTDYLESAIYSPFSQIEKPPLYDESAGMPPRQMFLATDASVQYGFCTSIVGTIPLEVDVEYL